DVLSTAVEAGVIANISKFDQAFPAIANAAQAIIGVPLQYLQAPVEKILSYTKNIEGEDYYKQRLSMTEAERLQSMNKTCYHYLSALGVGWGSMVGASHIISKVTHTPVIHNS